MTDNVVSFWRYVYDDQVTVPPGILGDSPNFVTCYVAENSPHRVDYVDVSRERHGSNCYRLNADHVTLSRRGKGYAFLCEGRAEFDDLTDEVRTLVGLVPHVNIFGRSRRIGDMTLQEAMCKLESCTADAFVFAPGAMLIGFTFPSLDPKYRDSLRARSVDLLSARP